MKKYRNEIDLFGKVKPAVSSKGQVHCGRSISGKLERRLNVHGLCEGTNERSLSRDHLLQSLMEKTVISGLWIPNLWPLYKMSLTPSRSR